jgi:hypothetical protein
MSRSHLRALVLLLLVVATLLFAVAVGDPSNASAGMPFLATAPHAAGQLCGAPREPSGTLGLGGSSALVAGHRVVPNHLAVPFAGTRRDTSAALRPGLLASPLRI